jgi:L-arabinose isomerase|tara:strand:- start:195 stop:419 length:225 start_codon:yes stop_codon:yes gene_type:complete
MDIKSFNILRLVELFEQGYTIEVKDGIASFEYHKAPVAEFEKAAIARRNMLEKGNVEGSSFTYKKTDSFYALPL